MTSGSRLRFLEDRTVVCVDCDASRTLSVSASGNMVCSTCGSDNWMHLSGTATIQESVSIRGELTVEADLIIEGRVEGQIELRDHILWISPNVKVNAQIHARGVIIAGHVVGDISASEIVEIRLSGSMVGNIKCPRISIADGAKFKGRIDTEAKANPAERLDSPKTKSATMSPGSALGRLLSKS